MPGLRLRNCCGASARLHHAHGRKLVRPLDVRSAWLAALREPNIPARFTGEGFDISEAFKRAGFRQIAFKGSLLEPRRDLDLECVKALFAKPGQVLFLDDPRAALAQQ